MVGGTSGRQTRNRLVRIGIVKDARGGEDLGGGEEGRDSDIIVLGRLVCGD